MFQGDKRSVHCENCAIRLSKKNEEESIKKNEEESIKKNEEESIKEKVKEILIKYGIKSLGQKIGVLEVHGLMFKIAKQQTETLYNEEQVYKILQELRLEIKSGVQKWQEDFEFDLEDWFENNKKK
jgi:carbonic anhydrase